MACVASLGAPLHFQSKCSGAISNELCQTAHALHSLKSALRPLYLLSARAGVHFSILADSMVYRTQAIWIGNLPPKIPMDAVAQLFKEHGHDRIQHYFGKWRQDADGNFLDTWMIFIFEDLDAGTAALSLNGLWAFGYKHVLVRS